MDAARGAPVVAYVLRSFPRLSQTFVLGEALALQRRGLDLRLFPVTDPREAVVQSEIGDLSAPVRYLDESTGRAGGVLEHVRVALANPRGYSAALRQVARERDADRGYHAASRWKCFRLALHLAAVLRGARGSGPSVDRLHAHFAHDPTLIAMLTHLLSGIPFSFTAHARDLYQVPVPALVRRARLATAMVTCCRANDEHLRAILPDHLHGRVRLIRHGVDVERFRPPPGGRGSPDVPTILSAGRLVPKKGFDDLLRALDLVHRAGRPFRCVVVGEGPLRSELAATAGDLGLEEVVSFAGPRRQSELLSEYQRADVFVATPFRTREGDVDGIPNVLLEAMACGIPIVATATGGIPEAVVDGENGLLAAPRDVEGVAANVSAMLAEPGLRRRMGDAARRVACERFDQRTSAEELARLFQGSGR